MTGHLPLSSRLALLFQWLVARILSLLWLPCALVAMGCLYRYRIKNSRDIRRRYSHIMRDHDRPLLICANHLTMVDSFVVCWALGSPWWYLWNFSALPWHVPERTNFAASWPSYLLMYMVKSVPVLRGGSRKEVSKVLARLRYLLSKGEVVFVFPEGGRSRTGRVQVESAAWGVGRILKNTPGCRVLCVYLRGDHQETWSEMPVREESFEVELSLLEPTSDQRGMRRSLDLARQVVQELADMEQRHFAGRERQGLFAG